MSPSPARACTGAEIALRESVLREIEGRLPSGESTRAHVRVVQPWTLVMLKCLALDDRHRNLRGVRHSAHDRDEAMTHAGDIVEILRAQADQRFAEFRVHFHEQLGGSTGLRERVMGVVSRHFADENGQGLLLYQEFLTRQSVAGERAVIQALVERAQRLAVALVQPLATKSPGRLARDKS